jgi:uncharacterized protein
MRAVANRFRKFGLVLMMNHACNLRCTYCYTGAKFSRAMPSEVGRRAIDRALASIEPGGRLELGFFGGEPLLEADLIEGLIAHARGRAAEFSVALALSMTTNGTITGPAAWRVMNDADLELSVSFDGRPTEHDRHRLTVAGRGSSDAVLRTMAALTAAGRAFSVVAVVRSDTVAHLAEGLEFLRGTGVKRVDPSLDLWCRWSPDDVNRLVDEVGQCADVWAAGLPDFSVSWFDEKAAHLMGVMPRESAACGFGTGEIAVAPSGNLYPCERLIGEDQPGHPMRLDGHATDGGADFVSAAGAPGRAAAWCDVCALRDACTTVCRCSNYVRTGDVRRPDGLLCAWNQACIDETARVLGELAAPAGSPGGPRRRTAVDLETVR